MNPTLNSQPRPIVVFDEMFSHKHVAFLASECPAINAQHLRKMGWSGMPDQEWLMIALKQNMVVIMNDRNDVTRGVTVRQISKLRGRMILVGPFFDHLSVWSRAKFLVKYAEKISAAANALEAGEIVIINRVARPTQIRQLD